MRRILTIEQDREWEELLDRVEGSDIYFTLGYHVPYVEIGDGQLVGFVYSENDDYLLYPFLVKSFDTVAGKPLGETWKTISTVYGYSGPLSTTTNTDFLKKAWNSFHQYCLDERIIGEFIRFNPASRNNRFVLNDCLAVHDRDIVYIDLQGSQEELWQHYPSIQRNMVRKAQKSGCKVVEVSVNEGWSDFKQLYDKSMTRQKAAEYYFFSDMYYLKLIDKLGERLRLFTVQAENKIVAASLIFVYKDRLHYHLSASDEEWMKFAPTNLLLHEVSIWGQKTGKRLLQLGGGRTNSPNDSLFKFKTSISVGRLPFFIGFRIHEESIHNRLRALWIEQKKPETVPDVVLLYLKK